MYLVIVAPEDSKVQSWAKVPHPGIKSILYYTLDQLGEDAKRSEFLRLVQSVTSRLVLVVPRTELPDDVKRGLRAVGRRMYYITEPYVREGREGLMAILETLKITSRRGRQPVVKIGSADPHELHSAQTLQRNYNAGVNVIFGGATPKVNTPEEAASGKRPTRRSLRPARPTRNRTASKNHAPAPSTPVMEPAPVPAASDKPGAFGLSRIARPPASPEEAPADLAEETIESVATELVSSEPVLDEQIANEATTASESSDMELVSSTLATPLEGGGVSADATEDVAGEIETPVATEEPMTAEEPVAAKAPAPPNEAPVAPVTMEEAAPDESATVAKLLAPAETEDADMESAPAIEEADADEAGGGADKPAPRKRTSRESAEKSKSAPPKKKAKAKKNPKHH